MRDSKYTFDRGAAVRLLLEPEQLTWEQDCRTFAGSHAACAQHGCQPSDSFTEQGSIQKMSVPAEINQEAPVIEFCSVMVTGREH